MNGAVQQNGNGGIGLGDFDLTNIFGIGAAFKKPKAPFNPRDIPSLDVVSLQQLATVQARIDAAIEAGGSPSQADLTQIQTITAFRTSQANRFVEQLRLFPEAFQSIGIAIGTTPQQALAQFSENLAIILDSRFAETIAPADLALVRSIISLFTLGLGTQAPITTGPGAPTPTTRFPVATAGTGARGIATRLPAPSQQADPAPSGQTAEQGAVATFLNCLSSAFGPASTTRGALQNILSPRFFQTILSAIIPGGRAMPFVATSSPAATTQGFDFGGFLGGAIDIAKRFLGPTVGPGTPFPTNVPTAGFPLLAPAARAIAPFARSLLPAVPAFGGGVVGGLVENFFDFGGAGTLDESAAFTDPVPGSCRPKMHVKKNPCTGKGVWFVPRGRPLVFSGDLSAAKRLDRVAKTLDKARPRRRHHHHTKRRPR